MTITFPQRATRAPVKTPMVRAATRQLLAAHTNKGGFVVFTGAAGVGKTTAASIISSEVNAAYDSHNGDGTPFRARRFEVTNYRTRRGDSLQRDLIAEIGRKVAGVNLPVDVRRMRLSDAIDSLVEKLVMDDIELVFVDEAGRLPPDGLDAIAAVINRAAEEREHRLTIVLVGMDDLPSTIRSRPQILRRVVETVVFEPCEPRDIIAVLSSLHPYFNSVDLDSPDGKALAEFLVSPKVSGGGLFGYLIPLVERAVEHYGGEDAELNVKRLQAVSDVSRLAEGKALTASKRGWRTG